MKWIIYDTIGGKYVMIDLVKGWIFTTSQLEATRFWTDDEAREALRQHYDPGTAARCKIVTVGK